MYPRIILLLLLVIIAIFIFFQVANPVDVSFILIPSWLATKQFSVTLPVTVLVFLGFLAGVTLAVFNSLFFDARRALRDMKARREQKAAAQSEADFRLGSSELIRGRNKKARNFFERAHLAAPGDVDTLLKLYEAYLADGLEADALKVLSAGLARNPGNVEILMELAARAAATGDDASAEKYLRELLDDYGDNAYAIEGLRDLKVRGGLWDEAAEFQRKIVSLKKGEEDLAAERELLGGYLFESAQAALSSGELELSAEKAKEALKVDDAFIPAHILIGEAKSLAGDDASAIKAWQSSYDKFLHHALMLKVEGAIMKESDPRSILDRYEAAINKNPNDVKLKLLLARLYLKLEMVDDAMVVLDRLSSEGEEGFYHQVLLGEAHSRRDDTRRVSALIKKALGLDTELTPPFECSHCACRLPHYAARCSSCLSWNTFEMSIGFPPSAQGGGEAEPTAAPALEPGGDESAQ